MSRRLISCDEAVQSDRQHTQPCSDCPFARTALNGWLGGLSVFDWLITAHSDAMGMCHVVDNQQCAGLAIYRANVVKLSRDQNVLVLPKDKERVFATPTEFQEHHTRRYSGPAREGSP